MLTKTLIYIPSIFGVVGIGTFVIMQSKQVAFRVYGALSFSLAAWLTFQYLIDSRISNGKLWLQLASIALTVMVFSFALFVYAFKNQKLPKRVWLVSLFLPIVAFIPISFSKLYVTDVIYEATSVIVKTGPLFNIQTILLLIYSATGISILASRPKHTDPILRSQTMLLSIAFIVGVLGMALAGFVFPDSAYWQLARPLGVLMMLSIVAYAMIYRQLFDIRSYVVRGVVYFVTLGATIGLFALLTVMPATYVLHTPFQGRTILYLMVVTLVVAALFQPLRNFFNKSTNQLFYRDYYEPQDVLDKVSSLLVGAVSPSEIKDRSKAIIEDALNPISLVYLIKSEAQSQTLKVLEGLLHSQKNFIVTDEVDQSKELGLYRLLRKNEIALALKLQTTHEDLGYLVLGLRRSGAMYSLGDKRILRTIADEIAIGLQNALRFEEIQKFNETLQERITTATKKLSETNQRLKKLDETKDEFISMASHQLRTPLTSVKGYLSMALEGDAGNLNKNQRKLLEQSFVSSQRMVYLISDLLNLSRLNTGRFVIESTQLDLSEVIQDEVNQLAETAKSRELKLLYKRPEHFPKLMLDENKTHQVVMNFLDNAIYYTPAGGTITIDLHETPTSVIFTVKDTGIGVPRAVQHKLFTKFYRAQNAQQARPDGTGLGLFMAKKVIAAQGGSLIFESIEGKGSTFGFRFSKSRVRVPADVKAVDDKPDIRRAPVVVK